VTIAVRNSMVELRAFGFTNSAAIKRYCHRVHRDHRDRIEILIILRAPCVLCG
jgi:hypothetical protein